MKKTQVFFIHGGMTFKRQADYVDYLKNREASIKNKKKWQGAYLDKMLGQSYQVIRPNMPLAENAKYADWKIAFENYFPLLTDGIILIGSSLGGNFLAKYLSENRFPRKIRSVILVRPPFDGKNSVEDLAGGFRLGKDIRKITKQCRDVHLIFSPSDEVVPIEEARKYAKKLPEADILILDHLPGHSSVSRFPEVIRMIKKSKKKK